MPGPDVGGRAARFGNGRGEESFACCASTERPHARRVMAGQCLANGRVNVVVARHRCRGLCRRGRGAVDAAGQHDGEEEGENLGQRNGHETQGRGPISVGEASPGKIPHRVLFSGIPDGVEGLRLCTLRARYQFTARLAGDHQKMWAVGHIPFGSSPLTSLVP